MKIKSFIHAIFIIATLGCGRVSHDFEMTVEEVNVLQGLF